MANDLGLEKGEYVVLRESGVAHGTTYGDELVLTNKRIICLNKSLFGRTSKIYCYPLDQIVLIDGLPQVKQGRLSNGALSLDVYLQDGDEHFGFQLGKRNTIELWVDKIHQLFGFSPTNETHEPTKSYSDDTVLGAFKEVGYLYRDIGRDLAESFGFRSKKKTENKNYRRTAPGNGAPNVSVGTQSLTASIKCPNCGKSTTKGARFCTYCGFAMNSPSAEKRDSKERVCPACGEKIELGLRFCTECGTDLGTYNEDAETTENIQQDTLPNKTNLTIDQQIDLLNKLKSLLDAGAITPEEYEKKKKDII